MIDRDQTLLSLRQLGYDPGAYLPPMGGGGCMPIRYLLTSDWSGGVATADIFDMEGNLIAEDATIRDPENIFAIQSAGERGYGDRYNGKYYANRNAKCPSS